MKRYIYLPIIGILIFVFVGRSLAYIPDASYILSAMLKRYGNEKSLFIEQRHIIYREFDKKTELFETLSYIFPDKFRSDIKTDDTEIAKITSSDIFLYLKNGKPEKKEEPVYHKYKNVLLYRTTDLLSKQLQSMGIDTSVVSLGRFEEKICFVIGANYPDESAARLFIDKKNIKPIRLILKDPLIKGDMIDIRYNDWEKFEKAWYPRNMEIYRNQNPERKLTITKLTVNKEFDLAIFDTSSLSEIDTKEEYGQENDKDEVQKAIESFKRKFE